MPPILAVKYPIYATVTPNAQFTISDGSGRVIFTGKSVTNQVDISNIIQDYLNSEMVTVTDENLPVVENGVLTKTFFVNSSAGLFTAVVSNNYNDVWEDQITDDMLVSDIIGDEVHPEQIIFADALSPNNTGVINISGTNYPVNGSASIAAGVDGIYELRLINEGTSAISGTFIGIAYGNGVFVGVGNYGQIATSPDGVNWSLTVIFQSDYNIQSVVFGNGLFVAVGQRLTAGFYLVSADNGKTWTQTSTSNTPLFGIDYGNGLFVAVGNLGVASSSSNGVNWTISNVGFNQNNQVICYGRGLFVVVNNGVYSYSTDGVNWVSGTHNFSGPYYGLAYGNGVFVGVGYEGRFITSANAVNWSGGNVGNSQTLYSIAFGNGIFVSVGRTGYYAISSNGQLWSIGQTSNRSLIYEIAYGNGRYVAVGDQGSWAIFDTVQISTTDISFNGAPIEFTISDGCERYAIYFVNRLGGRSSMLVKGYTRDGITYDSFRIKTNYDRLDPKAFETRTIRNNEYKVHTFNTSWLSDEDNDKIDDLISSPRVWIHDFENGLIKSAYVSQNSFTNKRYRTDKVSNNQISIIEAQNHTRR